MKKSSVIAVLLCFECIYGNDASVPGMPTVYTDISEAAQEDSIKFDGTKLFAGAKYSQCKINIGITNSGSPVDHAMNFLGLTVGGEYAKSLKKKFLVSVGIALSVETRGRKEGTWKEINPAYYTGKGQPQGDSYAALETVTLIPVISLKLGYQLKSYSSLLFLKAGVSMEKVKCVYKFNGNEIGNAKMMCYTPLVGIGVERKFNHKWGAAIEATSSIARKSKKIIDNYSHQIRFRRVGAAVMGTYTLKGDL